MNILFIGYWSLNDGLTQSTILPHLEMLAQSSEVENIVFSSIERNGKIVPQSFSNNKTEHLPLYTRNLPVNIFNKIGDFIRFPKLLTRICHEYEINHIICRGAPAGSLGYLVSRKTGISFSVESFEPHAEYMLESGVWKKWDPRYIMQKRWEEKQKKYALALFPVAKNYEFQLIKESVPSDKIFLQPCDVDLNKFIIDSVKRNKTREKLRINQNAIVGIYVGKFGDIYWDEEAFLLFGKMLKLFRNRFSLVILSPLNQQSIVDRLIKNNFPPDQYLIVNASYDQVSDYLNASDFAFALYRPGPNKKYLSPIKIGEYWACGLPVIIPDGIGDDSRILKETGLGVVIKDLEHPEKYFHQLEELIKADKKEEIRQLAMKYRNPAIVQKTYEKLIKSLSGVNDQI